MQIPVLSGIFTTQASDYRIAYPVNLVPVALPNGASAGYLRPADGLVAVAESLGGVCRGLVNWDDVLYGVFGASLVQIDVDYTVTVLGTVADGGPVRFTYGFDRLAVASGNRLYYWNGSTLTEVTDPDLGVVLDVVWIDGYYMTTDGANLVVTELTDPTQVNPLKYGSSEANPDPVVALLRTRNEVAALNRYTIEFFDNIGGLLFPFDRIEGAQIQKGVVGTHACCLFLESVAFLGSGYNEQCGVYLGEGGRTTKLSTVEIDRLLTNYTAAQLSTVVVEARNDNAHQHLYVHLPDRTIVYDAAASGELGKQVWFTLTSTLAPTFAEYRARFMVWCYDRWLCGDPTDDDGVVGEMVQNIGSHYGDDVRWEFSTQMLYNEGKGVLVNALELVALAGRAVLGDDPSISTSYSLDGMTWSQDRFISAGKIGERNKRLTWFRQGSFRDQRFQRFRGDSRAHLSVARLEADMAPLEY